MTLGKTLVKLIVSYEGCAHSDDARVLFPIIGTPQKLQENDEKMMRLFTGFMETYAKTK